MEAEVIDDPRLRERTHIFKDRFHAGILLAERLKGLIGREANVLAIPAGGVPVGVMVSKKLNLDLELLFVRKLHLPWDPEAGFGAVSLDGAVVLNQRLVDELELDEALIKRCIEKEIEELKRRARILGRSPSTSGLEGKTAILVDDGLASGFTMLAAVKSARKRRPKEIIIAAPTGSRSAISLLKPHVERIVCLNIRSGLIFAVADAYMEWYDLSDEEIIKILHES